jgi:hypothetical protein
VRQVSDDHYFGGTDNPVTGLGNEQPPGRVGDDAREDRAGDGRVGWQRPDRKASELPVQFEQRGKISARRRAVSSSGPRALLALKSLSDRSLPEPRPGTMSSDRTDHYILQRIEQVSRISAADFRPSAPKRAA